MKNNPILNALFAILYICSVASVMFYFENNPPSRDTIFAPIAFLSLFTLSAAIMGYLFLGQPFQLYLDGKKKEATTYFFHTVAAFGILTAFIFIALNLGLRF